MIRLFAVVVALLGSLTFVGNPILTAEPKQDDYVLAVYEYWELEHENMEDIITMIVARHGHEEGFAIRFRDYRHKELIGVFHTNMESRILNDEECCSAITGQLLKKDGYIAGISWNADYQGYEFGVYSPGVLSIRYIYKPGHCEENTASRLVLNDDWYVLILHKT